MENKPKAPEQFRVNSVVFVVLTRENHGEREILLQLRKNTSYMPGMYDLSASGKVEPGEPASAAAIREAEEEIGVKIKPEDLHFFHVHHNVAEKHIKLFFWTDTYESIPRICEPESCGDLMWTPDDSLPDNIIPYLRDIIEAWHNERYYSDLT